MSAHVLLNLVGKKKLNVRLAEHFIACFFATSLIN